MLVVNDRNFVTIFLGVVGRAKPDDPAADDDDLQEIPQQNGSDSSKISFDSPHI